MAFCSKWISAQVTDNEGKDGGPYFLTQSLLPSKKRWPILIKLKTLPFEQVLRPLIISNLLKLYETVTIM